MTLPVDHHVLFGTHNRLPKIATTPYPEACLEIIAIDPAAPPPRLIHVVVRTDELGARRRATPGAPALPYRHAPALRAGAATLWTGARSPPAMRGWTSA